jgi:hypothetical protein
MIEVIPEIAAEVVGYARSNQRDPGLHLIIDVGAGTLDVSAFVLSVDDNEDDRYSILTADVQMMGSYELHQHRVSRLTKLSTKRIGSLGKNIDPLKPMPEMESYEKHGYQRAWDDGFQEKCTAMLCATLLDLKRRRYPNSPRWNTSLPVFLCGGGCGVPLYREALVEAFGRMQENYDVAGYEDKTLPMPQKISAVGLPPGQFHRLAVAFGLSYRPYDIGEIRSPHEIEDMPRPDRRRPAEFISKDQV